jgi:dihydrofolate reductase
MKLSLIAAVAKNGVIGAGNDLVWREPQDQRHFSQTTHGHAVVMGRKTWQSLPPKYRPLPGRRNVVVTRDAGFAAPGAECVAGLEAALALLAGAPQVYVIGGAELYAAALPRADELVLTEIEADIEGDTRFPDWDRSAFEIASRQPRISAQGVPFAFVTYRRRAAG